MLQELSIAAVAHVIQLAVAPVFLLTGIGSMLAVMTNRMSRIVARARRHPGLQYSLRWILNLRHAHRRAGF